jgi:hypothetical protein
MPSPAVLAAVLRFRLPRLQDRYFPRTGEIVQQHDAAVFEHIERPVALAV